MLRRVRFFQVVVLAAATASLALAQSAAPIEFYRLAAGFLPEAKNAIGDTLEKPFAESNPWAFNTVYLMATNAKGQRTWRIDNFLPQKGRSQGSSMYLLEGSQRALLVDTGQNTEEEMGKNDLKTLVRHLLAHDDTGAAKTPAVDFVVAISHAHGDHMGKLAQMNDRTVYFPDLDWRSSAGPNWVPIKEGGGATQHGPGTAVGEIQLGNRMIKVIDVPCHTPGSVAFLDVENNMVLTSDAIGSGHVWAHFGKISRYAESVRHLQAVLKPMNNPAILPGHFYQVASGERAKPPINGRLLDKQYVDDQLAVAEGVLAGKIVGTAYSGAGARVVIAYYGTAGMTYSLDDDSVPKRQ
jgi:glyoxylase-like metal-dependent hydrolase (beta-lactamase superfamily II)